MWPESLMEFEPTIRSSIWVIRGGVPRTRATVDVCFTPEKSSPPSVPIF
jgi:hypothetical protein